MIISVSRRTDILSFYPDWFKECLKRGFVNISNPFNPNQRRVVSLRKDDVTAFVFWTRNALPSIEILKNIEKLKIPFYIMVTFTNYPKALEKNSIDFEKALQNFQLLSSLFSRKRIIWRYDPIIFSNLTNLDFHKDNFNLLVESLYKFVYRIIISFYDSYPHTAKRLKGIDGFNLMDGFNNEGTTLLNFMRETATSNLIQIQSCCEKSIFEGCMIRNGPCIDIDLLKRVWGLNIKYEKDKGQRKECLCHRSVDIGSYNTCKRGCLYCYAVR